MAVQVPGSTAPKRYCHGCGGALPPDFAGAGAPCPNCGAAVPESHLSDPTTPVETLPLGSVDDTVPSPAAGPAVDPDQETPVSPSALAPAEAQPAPREWSPEELQRRLGERYRIDGVIGAGGMGYVYKATDTVLDRTVAIKSVLPELSANRDWVQRLRAEARITARLKHPEIVQVHEVLDVDGHSLIVLEYVEGHDLRQVLRRGDLSRRDAVSMLAHACRAVAHAHARGVIHRDLKPANIMLTPDGQCKVMDFGIAGVEEDQRVAGVPQQTAGSPAFMAPELLTGESQGDPQSDIYALGVTLYSVLTGKLPFSGRMGREFVERVVSEAVVSPRAVNPEIDDDISAVCLKAMAKDPASRYASAADMAGDVEQWLQGGPVSARDYPLGRQIARALRQYARTFAGACVLTAVLFGGIYLSADHVHKVSEGTILSELEGRLRDIVYGVGALIPAASHASPGTSRYAILDQPIRKLMIFNPNIRDAYVVTPERAGAGFRVTAAWHEAKGTFAGGATMVKGHDSWGATDQVRNDEALGYMRRALAGEVLVQFEEDTHRAAGSEWDKRLLGYAPIVDPSGAKTVFVVEMSSHAVAKAFGEIERARRLTMLFGAMLSLSVLAVAGASLVQRWNRKD